SVTLEDLAQADLVLIAGANPASNHPRLVGQLVALRRRGGKVVMVNPLRELGLVRFRVPSAWRSLLFGATVSDPYLQPHVGADAAGVLLGGNLVAGTPDGTWAAAALRRIPTSIAITTVLSEGHVHGGGRTAIILPVLARDEEAEATTQESMFNFVRLSEGGTPAVAGEMRSEVEVIASLAELILPSGRFDWSALRSHRRLREEMAKVVPGFGALARIDETRREFTIASR